MVSYTNTYLQVSNATKKKNFKIAEVLTEIQTEQLLNRNLDHYCYTIMLGTDVVHILKWLTNYSFETPSNKYCI
jgi:hypothetical protein